MRWETCTDISETHCPRGSCDQKTINIYRYLQQRVVYLEHIRSGSRGKIWSLADTVESSSQRRPPASYSCVVQSTCHPAVPVRPLDNP